MVPKRSKTLAVLLAVIWLAVVGMSVYLAIARRDEYGFTAYIAVGMAVVMLVIFVLNYLPKKLQIGSFPELLGKLATGGLILLAIGVLITAIVAGTGGILGTGVLGLFAVIFVRIFVDYIKDFNKPRKESPQKQHRRSRARQDE